MWNWVVGGVLLSPTLFAAIALGPATWGNPDRPWGTRRPVTSADRAVVAEYRAGHRQPFLDTKFANPFVIGLYFMVVGAIAPYTARWPTRAIYGARRWRDL